MSKAYETIVILNAHLSQEQLDANIEKFLQVIKKENGDIKLVDRWGKRRLAYEIAKKQYGYYVYIRFDADGSTIQALEREFKLDESVLRYLTVLVPKVVLKDEKIEPMEANREDDKMEQSDDDAKTESKTVDSDEPVKEASEA